MNYFRRLWLDRQLKRALARNKCRLDSGIRGLRNDLQLTLEYGVKLHQVKINARTLRIGAYTDIVSGTELQDVSHIGRYCSIARNVTLGQNRKSHPLNWLSTHSALAAQRHGHCGAPLTTEPTRQTVIGHDVWIGMDALILEGVTIGTGAVIGARSLVTRDVPPYAVVTGSPARVQRYRFEPAVIEGLLASQWWNLPPEHLARLPLEDPEKLLEALQGVVVPDRDPGSVTVCNKPFSVTHRHADPAEAAAQTTARSPARADRPGLVSLLTAATARK
ncbi:antibiotic acetyltransferase [Pseudomonas sp. RIT412]|nr:antibiotic acetyltransferase [Pseudomonas sp. RIT 409]RAU51388.1 antibiotic acetyltransferase [Pseudomonas sp. RIT 412]